MLDLAFGDEHRWTVVNFKTNAELAGDLERYRRQVRLCASNWAALGTAIRT